MKANLNSNISLKEQNTTDLSPLEILTQEQAPVFSGAAIETMAEAIQECEDASSLASALGVVLSLMLCTFGSHSLPDNQLNKDFVRVVGSSVRDKLGELAGAPGRETAQEQEGLASTSASPNQTKESQAKRGEVLKEVLDNVFDELHEDISDKCGSISPAAARNALGLLSAVFRPYATAIKTADFSVTSRAELVGVVLVHAILAQSDIRYESITRECHELVFSLLYGTLNIQEPNYKAFLRADLPDGRLALLGYCLGKGHGDSKLVADELLNQLESKVLNDKQPSGVSERQVAFFYPFLSHVTSEHVKTRIMP
jgi:hypothetical protein